MSWRYPAQTPRSLASSVRGGWCETEGRTRRATRAATPRPLLPAVSRAFMTGLLVASVLLGICRVWHLKGCQGGQIRRSHTPGVTRSASVAPRPDAVHDPECAHYAAHDRTELAIHMNILNLIVCIHDCGDCYSSGAHLR